MTLSRAMVAAACVLPFVLAVYAVGLHASIGRPIWIDEFTHFAIAALPSTSDAWASFRATANDLHHGQTGVYVLLNYWTLTILGLDATLLRLPSILSGLFLFASAIMLMRVLGFPVLWQIVMVGALTGQHLLMYLLGEARPYAPIPAVAVGMLLYYVARPIHPQSRVLLGFGILTAAFGSVIHVYFAVYWPAVCLVAYVHRLSVTGGRFSLRALIRFADPGLVCLGAGLYLLLAALTWLRGQPHFAYDPLEWLHRYGPFANFTDYSHTQFLHGHYAAAALLTGGVLLAVALLPAAVRGSTRGLWAPALLMLLALGISVLLAAISYLSHYWILPRQWIGSVALFAVGAVWFWAELARIWSRQMPAFGLVATVAALLLVANQAASIHHVRLTELQARLTAPHAEPGPGACEPPASLDRRAMSLDQRNDMLVALANRNLRCGGPIWPVFRAYYPATPHG